MPLKHYSSNSFLPSASLPTGTLNVGKHVKTSYRNLFSKSGKTEKVSESKHLPAIFWSQAYAIIVSTISETGTRVGLETMEDRQGGRTKWRYLFELSNLERCCLKHWINYQRTLASFSKRIVSKERNIQRSPRNNKYQSKQSKRI